MGVDIAMTLAVFAIGQAPELAAILLGPGLWIALAAVAGLAIVLFAIRRSDGL